MSEDFLKVESCNLGKHCFVLPLMTELLLIFMSDSVLMLILNSLGIPQFAVEKYVGNLQNGELRYNPATWGSHEFGIIPSIWRMFQTSNLGKCYDSFKKHL